MNYKCVFVGFGIQHEKRMRRKRIAIFGLPYFSTLFHKRHDFWEEGEGEAVELKMCGLILSTIPL